VTPRKAIEFVGVNDFMDEPDFPVRDQLAEQARSMAKWAGLNLVLFSVPIIAWNNLGSTWSLIIAAIFLGKGSMYAYEAKRLSDVIGCFDRHDARTLKDLDSGHNATQ
jgi:hypothetical protein